jgi:cytochrome c oxidase subunit II
MSDHDHETLPPTPGARVGKFAQRKDVRQTFLLGLFYTAVFVVLGRWIYPHWMPTVLSKQMQAEEDILIWFTVISAPIAGVVLAIATKSFMNMHRGDTPPEEGVAIRTNTPVVVIWTAVSALFCTVAIVWGLVALNTESIAAATDAPKSLIVDVTGSQWAWSFYYPAQNIHTHTLNLPVNQPVTFNVISDDVNHSFWPVQLGVKIDANRLVTTVAHADPTATGPLDIKCAELCGIYHAYMETDGAVQTPADFSSWVSSIQATGGVQQ